MNILRTLMLGTLVCSSVTAEATNRYEQILLTKLRDKESDRATFRDVSGKLGELLVHKVVECLPSRVVQIETPVALYDGRVLEKGIELVSIMRSGDALLDPFLRHFPDANVSKVLVQRDEETALPEFKYMKLSASIADDRHVIITEPMIATGGTLCMVIGMLIERGVREENIVVASVCAAPEGLERISKAHPKVTVVMNALDDHLNEKSYIVPGLGDFGDRFFGG